MKKMRPNIALALEIIEEAVSLVRKFPNDLTVLREQMFIIDARIKELIDIAKGE